MNTGERHEQPTTITPIPEDIVYSILDHLRDDIPALSACSVVCRAWLRPSRRHLFNMVVLFHGSISVQERGGIPALTDFLRACTDARQFLQHLLLSSELWRVTDVPHTDDTLPLDGDELLAILDIGTNIQHLTLIDVVWMDNTHWVPPLPRRTLKRLDISEWITSDRDALDVLKLISAFERVDVLALSLSVERSFTEDTTGLLEKHAETGHFPSVRSFMYYTSSEWPATPLYRVVERSCRRDRDALMHMSFRTWDYADSWDRIAEFCRYICDSDIRFNLRELEFHPGSGTILWSAIPLTAWGVLNLSRLEELVQLTVALDCENVHHVLELSGRLNAYAFILRSHPPPALKRIMIRLHTSKTTREEVQRSHLKRIQDVSHRHAWRAFDEALQGLPTSPRVIFECVGQWDHMIRSGAMYQCCKEVLPQTHARGLLECMVGEIPTQWW
ncbi:hypothetical protein C8Q73DRAFT_118670 [Cubamyces lactineus]|nr:hypothetical protein C8Q73DRAFT_118670 [Cubamyces lactineus]